MTIFEEDVRDEDFEERSGTKEEVMYNLEISVKQAMKSGITKGEIVKIITEIFEHE